MPKDDDDDERKSGIILDQVIYYRLNDSWHRIKMLVKSYLKRGIDTFSIGNCHWIESEINLMLSNQNHLPIFLHY